MLLASSFSKRCSWHRSFQLSTRVFHDLFISWINEVNATQFSSIVELRFFSTIPTVLSKSLATKCLVWRWFAFLSVSFRTKYTHPVLPLRVSSNFELRVSSYPLRFVCFDGRRMFSPRDQKDPDVHDANSACV